MALRAGLFFIHNTSARTASKAKGGSVGQRRGATQHGRPDGSTESPLGVSTLVVCVAGLKVVECPGDPECKGVFTGAEDVDSNVLRHLKSELIYEADTDRSCRRFVTT